MNAFSAAAGAKAEFPGAVTDDEDFHGGLHDEGLAWRGGLVVFQYIREANGIGGVLRVDLCSGDIGKSGYEVVESYKSIAGPSGPNRSWPVSDEWHV